MSAVTLSIIIPVYKNKELFFHNLEKNWQYIKKYEVIVVDDASDEDIGDNLKKKYPEIVYILNSKNQGFGVSVNRGVQKSNGKYIFLLNSDVILTDFHFENAILFLNKHTSYFGVGFVQKEKDNTLVGKNNIFYRKGFLFHKKAEDILPGLNGWAEGGSSILRKKYFEQLHGFSALFKPFYFEDIDLSYRAYKRGWNVAFDPEICVIHHHESTISKYFSHSYIQTVSYRNHFIFMWKNITDKMFWVKHVLCLPYYFVQHFLLRDWNFFKGFFSALKCIPELQRDRKIECIESNVTDAQIVSLFS